MRPENDTYELDQGTQELFQAARAEKMTAPPFLKSRVLVTLQARKRQHRQLILWRSLAASLLVLVLAGLANVYWKADSNELFIASIDRPIAVKVELPKQAELQAQGIEIVLPEGVSFYSETISNLADRRSLRLQIDASFSGATLPIIIRSGQPGVKDIKVQFLDEHEAIIREKSLRIDFKEGDVT